MKSGWILLAALGIAVASAPAWARSCSKDLQRTHAALRDSKASPTDIAQAWQQIDAARTARQRKQFAACRSDVKTALDLLQQTATKS